MKIIILLLSFIIVAAVSIQADADTIDVEKSITIGGGQKTVFEFTDPDCPYCRKASKYFEGRPDVIRHIFLYPLPMHPRAKEKARFILSMPDKAKAYNDVMLGLMDTKPKLPFTAEGIKLQEEQSEIAQKQKVVSTPTFLINGRIIVGFDLKKIEEALGKQR